LDAEPSIKSALRDGDYAERPEFRISSRNFFASVMAGSSQAQGIVVVIRRPPEKTLSLPLFAVLDRHKLEAPIHYQHRWTLRRQTGTQTSRRLSKWPRRLERTDTRLYASTL